MKKLLLALVTVGILSISSMGQQKTHCDSIAIVEVRTIEGHPIGPISGARVGPSYRQAS